MSCIRETIENDEKQRLCDQALLSMNSAGRRVNEEKCDIRTDFQRDRDRIVHCDYFRRLKHKTQVFLSPERDHYRTRLTHTLEVAQIARTIARALRLNEDLTEAVAMGHDLGHTPFGHAGERALNECLDGGFKHYLQSVRVVEQLENNGRGLNLTYEVVDGIRCHTNMEAGTLEGRIVRFADKIAYMNHDIDDSIEAGIMVETDLPPEIREGLGDRKSRRINTLVKAVINGTTGCNYADICMDEPYYSLYLQLHRYMFDNVYVNPLAKIEEDKAQQLVKTLFGYFSRNTERMPDGYAVIAEKEGACRAAADYIAGMSDNYAVNIYSELFLPKSWNK